MKHRLYSIYVRDGRRWKRDSPYAYHKELAIRVFQSRLLDTLLLGKPEARLRPVTKIDCPEAR
jgi:hypothetical protein